MHLVVAAVVVLLLVVAVAMWVLKRLLFVVPPTQLLLISGRRSRPGGQVVGYRTVRGGRAVRLPWIERADVVDLGGVTVTLESLEVRSAAGPSVRLHLTAELRITSDPAGLHRALEGLFGKTREEIAALARQVLVGTLVGVAASTTPEEMARDPSRLELIVAEESFSAIHRLGLELERVQITLDEADLYFQALAEAGG